VEARSRGTRGWWIGGRRSRGGGEASAMTVLSGAVEDGELVVFEGVVEGVGVGVGVGGVWGVGVMGGRRGEERREERVS
jgi:hypothetical protein